MSAYEGPGEGWRKEPYRRDLADDFPAYIYYFDGEAGTAVTWVPVEPVPPLPTEPHVVIRVAWRGLEKTHFPELVHEDDTENWWCIGTDEYRVASWIHPRITGFEVLAEPMGPALRKMSDMHKLDLEQARRETARAVIDREHDLWLTNADHAHRANMLRIEFGVDE